MDLTTVLEDAISYPPYKEEEDTFTIKVDTFNYNDICDNLRASNNEMVSLEGEKMSLIIDILCILNDNKLKYNVMKMNNFVFYWRGLPILVVKVKSDTPNTKQMMYIAVKTYQYGYNTKCTTRNLITSAGMLIGGILVLTAGAFLFKKLK